MVKELFDFLVSGVFDKNYLIKLVSPWEYCQNMFRTGFGTEIRSTEFLQSIFNEMLPEASFEEQVSYIFNSYLQTVNKSVVSKDIVKLKDQKTKLRRKEKLKSKEKIISESENFFKENITNLEGDKLHWIDKYKDSWNPYDFIKIILLSMKLDA